MSLFALLCLLLVLAIVFGAVGPSWQPGLGYYTWSPAGLIVAFILLAWLVGWLR